MKKRLNNKIVCIFMMLLLVVVGCVGYDVDSVWASTGLSGRNMYCYTLSGRVTTYKSAGGSYSGYIDSYDLVTIQEIYQNGWSKVNYPVAKGGRKTAFCETSKLIKDVNFSTQTIKLGINKNVYRRSNLSQKFGTVYANDNIYIMGNQGGCTQILYPISGGYKIGWISGNYSINSLAETSLANGIYEIVCAQNSNYVLDVYNLGKGNGVNVQIYQRNGGQNQKFRLVNLNNGYYAIYNVLSGKVLDVEGGKSYNETNVIQWVWNGGTNQQWKLMKSSDGYYSLMSRCNGLYLDVYKGNMKNETNVQCYKYNAGANQKFMFRSASSETTNTDMIGKLVSYEYSQVGKSENGNNNIIYNTWYYGRPVSGNGYAWCQAFQSYCANQCGIGTDIIPRSNSCTNTMNWFKNRGQWQYSKYRGGNYIPKAGDLVFYGNSKNSSSHVGLIVGTPVNGYLQVIEGNVKMNGRYCVYHFIQNSKRTLSSSYVIGYGIPNYR